MKEVELAVDDHALLELGAFAVTLPAPIRELESPAWLVDLLRENASAPLSRSEDVRTTVRDLLRHGGYKPTGRGKPASEYLVRAVGEGKLSSINLLVDACNVVSFHSGLPISVVDADLAAPPLRVGIAASDSSYVFNPSGQEIKVDGLLCLHDRVGPCANAVKDAQRTKTTATTRNALCLVWGHQELVGETQAATQWYQELLPRAGAECVAVSRPF